MTDDEKDQYINEYLAREGIHLDKGNIAENPAIYKVAKLFLNSLWGKWGERLSSDYDQSVILTSSARVEVSM